MTSDLERLTTLHVAANPDFLEGAGIASYGPKGWPVSRERRRQRHTIALRKVSPPCAAGARNFRSCAG
ncbi:hypothetical protein PSAB6_50207 [Paraburkholderia sabiae]|nr:hypothetical protein PSAB6_50207 [Paraburkholderia sabiae]